ncbi:MAG TPA: hypothetical protein PLC80_01725 [Draconibacterium sp.]|nr:hypothetical protein [Draconibacterium sp.]
MLNISNQRIARTKRLTVADLEKARYTCAVLIQRDKDANHQLIPLFERIEKEIEKMKSEQVLMVRILKVANDNNHQIRDTK